MRIIRPLSVAVLALALGACSRSSSSPALSDDLKQDLAKAGGGDMALAGSASRHVDVVSAQERSASYAPTPKAPDVARAPIAAHKRPTAPEPSPVQEMPAPQSAPSPEAAPVPVAPPVSEPAPANVPAAGRPSAPQPSTQREPRGGWRTPGDIIRRAPFPINP